MAVPLDVLIVTDQPDSIEAMACELQRAGFEPRWRRAATRADYVQALKEPVDLVLSDCALAQFDAGQALRLLDACGRDVPLVVITDLAHEQDALACVRRGAADYLFVDRLARLALVAARVLGNGQQQADGGCESEVMYRSLVERVPAIVYTRSLVEANAVYYTSPHVERILGFSQAEWMEGPTLWLRQLHPDDRMRVLAQLACSYDSREPFISEYRLLARDGRVLWFEDEAVVIPDGEGRPSLLQGVMLEVTDRKRAQEELEWERDFTAAILDTIGTLVVVLDRQGRIIRFNHACEKGTGYTFSEVRGKKIWDLFSIPKEGESVRVVFESMRDRHCPEQYENHWQMKDGQRRLIAWSNTVLLDKQGQVAYVMGTGSDITERRQAEETLQQRALQLALLNEIGGQIAAVLDLESVFDRAVKLMQQRFGYHRVALFIVDRERTELVMRASVGFSEGALPEKYRLPIGEGIVGRAASSGQRLLSNDVHAEVDYVNPFSEVIKGGAELSVPIRAGAEVMGVLDVQSSQVSAFDENDAIVVETLADQIAVAIQNSRLYGQVQRRLDELAFLYSAGRAMVSSLDLDRVLATTMRQAVHVLRVEAGSVLLLEEESGSLIFEASYGTGMEQLKGVRLPIGRGIASWVLQHRRSLVVPDVCADDRFYTGIDVESGVITRSVLCVPLISRERIVGVMEVINKVEAEFDGNDQRLLEALASTAAIAIDNARLYEAAHRELAERMRAEKALRKERTSLARRVDERTSELSAANAELARAARLKDEFLASMSHELRTPLNAILGLSEALQEMVYGPLTEKQQSSLHSIEESGRLLLALINDILDVAKIEAGKLTLHVGPVLAESVCQSSLRLVKQAAHKKQIQISLTCDCEVTTIEADARRLKQILVNLLSNAVKFTPEGGSMGLDVVGEAERQVVRFTVWDTGIGISEEGMGRLFQPFVQLDSSLSRQYEGTGLGLAMVRHLTELHGGGVMLESKVNEGSRFTVSLPWHGPVDAEACAGEGTAERSACVSDPVLLTGADSREPLVLMAEDSEANIATVVDYLRAKGCRVILARNGAECIARAREEWPDAILMDVQMPEMDGLEATRRIRADPDLRDVPIVALTALAMPGDRERCLEAGADVYLRKPVSLQHLVETIRVQIRQRRERRQQRGVT